MQVTEIEQVIEKMERLCEDGSVPSNVKNMVDRAVETLQNHNQDLSVRVNTATSLLDEVSNDPNIAQHTRTEVWRIASMLESLEEGSN